MYCNLSVKIDCLLQLQQAADKVDHQPKGGQQTYGGQYKKNLISIAQSLAEVHPELVSEWSEENLPLTPYDITFGSNEKVW